MFAEPIAAEDRVEVVTCEIGNVDFVIPPGAENHVVTGTSQPASRDFTLLSLSPHMHLRGKAFRYELVQPTGEREVLLDVPAYDFNWQTRYLFKEPRRFPAGSVLFCRAVFDNSEKNLANPDPSQPVRWGEQSWEEMMLGFFDVVLPPGEQHEPGSKPVTTGLDIVGMFDSADLDHNDGLSAAETAGHELISRHFAAIDQDSDELLHLGEILAAVRLMAARR
jgi:hypothetical protein